MHNTPGVGLGRALERFPDTRGLSRLADRFLRAMDCVDVGFLPDGTLDQLPPAVADRGYPCRRIDLNRREAPVAAAVVALSLPPVRTCASSGQGRW